MDFKKYAYDQAADLCMFSIEILSVTRNEANILEDHTQDRAAYLSIFLQVSAYL